VPTYRYACDSCGEFDRVLSMAELAPVSSCPRCGSPAPRRFAAPALLGTRRAVHRALDAAHRSADSPDVVTDLPPRRTGTGTPRSTDPRHARLPRP
jgi:putative FmdB family regulatory protein